MRIIESADASVRFLQLELGAPEMASLGDVVAAPATNLGSLPVELRP
jgi:hypothetical protein